MTSEPIEIDRDVTPHEFASQLQGTFRSRMETLVNEIYTPEFFEQKGTPAELIKQIAVPASWREMFLGTFNPARVHQMVYEQGDPYYRDRDLMIGLVKQISDEVKHSKIWGQIARQFGVEETDLTTWTPDNYDSLVAQCKAAVEYEKPQYVVCALQCTTEISPALRNQKRADYIESEYPIIADVLRRDIVKDEGDHVHIGRKVIERFATPDDYDRMLEIANNQWENTARAKRKQKVS